MKNEIKAAPAKAGSTPGPWLRQGRWISASFTPGQPMIANLVSDAYRSADESDANARLIAAAPALLAALKMFAFDYSPSPRNLAQYRDAARAAIALSEGGDK